MKIQCLHFCRKNILKIRPKSPPLSPKRPVVTMTREPPRRCNNSTCTTRHLVALVLRAQTQDALIPRIVTLQVKHVDGAEEELPRGYPRFPSTATPHPSPHSACGRIGLKSVETSQVSEKQHQPPCWRMLST